MTYVDAYKAAQSGGDFNAQLCMAVCTAAVNVLAEDTATANHTARVKWASGVLADPVRAAQNMAYGVMTNVTIQGEFPTIPDGDLLYTVNSLVNAYATGAA